MLFRSTSVTVFASVAVPASVLDFVGEVVVIVGTGAVLSICNVEAVLVAVLPALSVVLIFTL